MSDSNFLLEIPVSLGVLWLVRRFLEVPTRLPQLNRQLGRLWVPSAVLWLLFLAFGARLKLNGDLLDDAYSLVILGAIEWTVWQLRSYLPARTIGWALAPYVPYNLITIAGQLLEPDFLEKHDDTISAVSFFSLCWFVGLVFVARSQKKRLVAEAQRRAAEEREQQLILAKNTELEHEVQARTADLRQQTEELQQALDRLKATQAQLIQAEKMASLGELTAGIAHEIQNPLNFVNNFSEVSAELAQELAAERARPTRDAGLEAELVADLKQNLEKITQHGRRAASIVRGMLEHSRQSSGERQPVDLNALADEYLRLAYHGLRAKDKTFNAKLETSLAADLPRVPGVGPDLGRVLLNLLTNAFYAVQKRQQQGEAGYQPTVAVASRPIGHAVEISVRDNGTGIAPEVQQKIFQPFFTTKPTGEGTGLGLSLSYDIITKGHGGTLTVSSQAGVGTEFTLHLPL